MQVSSDAQRIHDLQNSVIKVNHTGTFSHTEWKGIIFAVWCLLLRLRHRGPDGTCVGRRRERGPGSLGTSPWAQGLGRELRPTEDDTPVTATQSDRAVAIPTFRLPEHKVILLPTDRSVQKGKKFQAVLRTYCSHCTPNGFIELLALSGIESAYYEFIVVSECWDKLVENVL